MNDALNSSLIKKTSTASASVPEKTLAKMKEGQEQKIPIIPDNAIKQIESFLNSKYTFRYNSVSNKVEFKYRDQTCDYVDLRDYEYNSILRELKLASISCSISTLRSILASNYVPIYDPYIEFVNALPNWDGVTDYIGALASTINTGEDEFWDMCFRKWLVAMAVSWCESKVINHTALILSGAQGIGKTTWLRKLIPYELSRYVCAGNINVRDKDSQLKLSECCIIIMDELENMSRNIDALKELITKSDIYVRRAYAYAHENYTRRASFAGSINGMDFLQDITGNRRFLCFEAKSIDYEHNVDLNGVYAQAFALAKQGFQFWFSQDEIARLDKSNEKFRAITLEEEQLTTFYEPCEAEDEDAIFMKTTDIVKSLLRLSGLRSLSDQRLGRVLNALGYKRTKRKDRYGYVLKQKNVE